MLDGNADEQGVYKLEVNLVMDKVELRVIEVKPRKNLCFKST
jgi:hypothetical protein